MKKLNYLFVALTLFAFISCGGGGSTNGTSEDAAPAEAVQEETVEEVDTAAATEEHDHSHDHDHDHDHEH